MKRGRPTPGLQLWPEQEWHRLTTDETLVKLDSDLDHGLSATTADTRLAEYGPNTITPQKGTGPLRRALAQFNQPLVIILILAGTVTAVLEEWVDAGVIFGVVVINAVVGYLQESKAVKAIEALSRTMTAEATVLRDGRRMRLSASELVPGDVVVLQAGDKIPADVRLTYSRDLRVDESALTGESVPVGKETAPLAAETELADRVNMAYASSLVTGGQGAGVVIATGDATEVGRISHLISETAEIATPLTRKIAQFSKVLLFVILGLALITAVVGIVRGEAVVDMFMAAVALAVGAIPEGLPAAVTITLAIGVSRMARRQAIIRKLPAVETLGSTTVICSDKTGTLTENQMTVQRMVTRDGVFTVTGGGYAPEGEVLEAGGAAAGGGRAALKAMLRAGVLCNDSSLYEEEGHWHVNGDPTEGALLVSAAKAGIDREELEHDHPRLDTVPFESEHQYMATLHGVRQGDDNSHVAYIKGAVEKVVARCSSELGHDGSLIDLEPGRIESVATEMASNGLRVLAFARKDLPAEVNEITHADVEEGLVFLGLQGMIDPPRREALQAIEACHAAGVQVKMITGDHVVTAVAIADQLNLRSPGSTFTEAVAAMSGAELAVLSDEELVKTVEHTHVFARVTPEQKLRLVNALQNQDHVVAMTGDGVNDAPALRQADIGVAMGTTGTEVAKEAADMVLTDDNFASIEAAVEEGRGVFDNLTKFIAWTLPTNVGEGLVILAAVFAGVALPILPVQILWINMTTAILLGLMLAFEPKEIGIMERPPRSPRAPILDRALIERIVIVGALLLIGAFGLYELAERTGHSLAEARTVAVNVFVLGEMFYLFNCRSLALPSWRMSLRTNHLLLAGVVAMTALQLLYTYLPGMNSLFGSAPIDGGLWAWVIGAALAIHIIVEIEKAIRRRHMRR
ncbi:MAG: cation-transporting P-type ATPase [Actinobacteria bacterium]|nr:cation-transporting P-type ATPase [Actinomycetota bacterium]